MYLHTILQCNVSRFADAQVRSFYSSKLNFKLALGNTVSFSHTIVTLNSCVYFVVFNVRLFTLFE